METHKRVCTESVLWEKNPLPHQKIEPVSVAWQSDALTNWATSPSPSHKYYHHAKLDIYHIYSVWENHISFCYVRTLIITYSHFPYESKKKKNPPIQDFHMTSKYWLFICKLCQGLIDRLLLWKTTKCLCPCVSLPILPPSLPEVLNHYHSCSM